MKIFNGCLSFLMIFSVLSCENPEQQNPSISENEELLTLFTVNETTQALGVFDKFQAQELTVEKTPMSLPYHIGNGVFGGVVPLVGTYLVDKTGNILAGLYFPIRGKNKNHCFRQDY